MSPAEVARAIIDEQAIGEVLAAKARPDAVRVREILAKAREARGLEMPEVAALAAVSDPELLGEVFAAAREVKERIYGRRLVIFAPLYVSNMCANECLYCAFRARNKAVKRRALAVEEIEREVRMLIEQGQKRVLLVAGESYPQKGFDYVLEAIEAVYRVKSSATGSSRLSGRGHPGVKERAALLHPGQAPSSSVSLSAVGEKDIHALRPAAAGHESVPPPGEPRGASGEIRRVNVNVAPLTLEEFRRLEAAKIGTYQLFQETYHRETYARVHLAGKKRDYDWRVTAMDRAMQAGIDDVGIGVLFGLCDWRFEVLAMMQHIRYLEREYGVGPHTISVPRLEPAVGSEMAVSPPRPVDDVDFRKIVAILRLAVPYTGIIMSTRETPNIRRESFALGVSQISAGSRTNPGGYSEDEEEGRNQVGTARLDSDGGQFSLGDHRSLDEVIRDVAALGYIPSFCTACYRLGRTGGDFMDLARPGEIKEHCDPNALSTFTEYLLDYASPATREVGERLVASTLAIMPEGQRHSSEAMIAKIRAGKRDVYC